MVSLCFFPSPHLLHTSSTSDPHQTTNNNHTPAEQGNPLTSPTLNHIQHLSRLRVLNPNNEQQSPISSTADE
ncbi:hypothetical protein PGT21_001470 [Puccinia graminis f. sp. tritici]|uniref:Uncharacterized protein n=1 Tax=Puccinia graminis f. sp. tritici TaxID=56615 RepID=A0A5B0PSK7_PUCGR|nr:hypothetical protein PGT21_001470 [Puccinia graminis f. sp. tritici]KAA1103673.1 hypothetical protein PGTUg99_006034 [Puccinia graminis f. sp. tritici]